MFGCGESQKEAIRPDFNRAIVIDFQGATISSDTGFILLREIDERFRIIAPMKDCLEDLRSPAHTEHALVQMVRQRVYQIAAGYEDCNDADYLRIDPALRLPWVKIIVWGPANPCSPGWRTASCAMLWV
jgi:hypothetical protein